MGHAAQWRDDAGWNEFDHEPVIATPASRIRRRRRLTQRTDRRARSAPRVPDQDRAIRRTLGRRHATTTTSSRIRRTSARVAAPLDNVSSPHCPRRPTRSCSTSGGPIGALTQERAAHPRRRGRFRAQLGACQLRRDEADRGAPGSDPLDVQRLRAFRWRPHRSRDVPLEMTMRETVRIILISDSSRPRRRRWRSSSRGRNTGTSSSSRR